MPIIKQPGALNFSGNLPDIVVTDIPTVSFSLYKGVTLILEEEYKEDAEHRIEIRIKDIIDGLLSLEIPTDGQDVYDQSGAYADFTAAINATNIAFRVIKGGVDASVIDTDAFLNSNFLTWQPQQKTVKFHDPEWLSYYAKTASVVKAKGYHANGSETITLGNLAAGKLFSVNTNYGYLISLFAVQPLYVDVWVEQANVAVSFVQRYILNDTLYDFDDLYIYENSLGGIDSIRFIGQLEVNERFNFSSALFDEDTLEYDVAPDQIFNKNTGFFRSERERAWSAEFFKSLQKYHLVNGTLKRIVVTKPELSSVFNELNDYKFSFAYSRQTKYLNLSRLAEVPPVLEIVGPDSDLFFLAPNLNAFPTAVFDNLLFLAQNAYDPTWKKLSINDLVAYIQDNIIVSLSGNVLTDYYNKSAINSFFSGTIPTFGYNKANWDLAYTWGNHAAVGYALAAQHYDKITSDARYIRNQSTLQADAKLHVAGGQFADYLSVPTASPSAPQSGQAYVWVGSSGSGGSTPPPSIQYFAALLDVSLSNVSNWQTIRYNSATGKFVNTDFPQTDLSAYSTTAQGDGRWLGINATAAGVLWANVAGRPTNLSHFSNDLALSSFVKDLTLSSFANDAGFITAANVIANQTALQAGAKFHVVGGQFNNYLAVPTSAPTDPQSGVAYVWVGGTGTGGSTPPPGVQYFSALLDVSLSSPQNGQVPRYNSTTGKWENGNAVSSWSDLTGKPTTLNGFGLQGEADARYLGINATAANSTKWANQIYNSVGVTTPGYLLTYDLANGQYGPASVGQIQSWLGLGSTAYQNVTAFYAAGSTVANSTLWAGYSANFSQNPTTLDILAAYDSTNNQFRSANANQVKTWLGLGSAAYLNASQSATANSVVQRDVNGYAFAAYFNQSSPSNENPTIGSFFVTDTTTGYLRKATVAHVQTQLGLGSNAFSSTAYLPIVGGEGNAIQGNLYVTNATNAVLRLKNIGGGNDWILQSYLDGKFYFGKDGANFYTIDGSGNNNWTGSATFGGALTGTSATFSGNVTIDNGQYFKAKRQDGIALNVLGFDSGTGTLSMMPSDYFVIKNTGAANLFLLDANSKAATLYGALTGTSATFGSAKISPSAGFGADFARFGHKDCDGSGSYGFLQYSNGNTYIGGPLSLAHSLTGNDATFSGLQVINNTSNLARVRVSTTDTTANGYRGFEFFSGSTFKGGLFQDQSSDEISIFTPIGGKSFSLNSAGSATFNGNLKIFDNWGGSADLEQLTIYGNLPSMAFRNPNIARTWLIHTNSTGDMQWWHDPTSATANNWGLKMNLSPDGLLTVSSVDVSGNMSIPRSAPVSPQAGKAYIWVKTS